MAPESSWLKNHIRDIPDFPRAGVVYKDITPLLSDVDAAQAWYDSDLYQEAIPFRHAASRGRVFIVEGWLPPLP